MKPTELSSASGISVSYASQIINGRRSPSRSLAIHLFNAANYRHRLLEGLTDQEISLLAKLEPWTGHCSKPNNLTE